MFAHVYIHSYVDKNILIEQSIEVYYTDKTVKYRSKETILSIPLLRGVGRGGSDGLDEPPF